MFRRVELEDPSGPFLWSDDGCRIAFHGHYSYWILSCEPEEDDVLCNLPYTFVCDVKNKKILIVYERHLQPMVWNDAQDGLVADGVECFNEREWLIACGGLPEEMRDIHLSKPAFKPGKEPSVKFVGHGDGARKDLGKWLKFSKHYWLVRLFENKLDKEYDRVIHCEPWAERSSQEDICRRVFDHVVRWKPY